MKLSTLNNSNKIEKALIKLNKEIKGQEKYNNNMVLKSLATMATAFGLGTVAYTADMGTVTNAISIACLFGGTLAGIYMCNSTESVETVDMVNVMNACGVECRDENKANFENLLNSYKNEYEAIIGNKKAEANKQQEKRLIKNYASQICELAC